MTREEAKSCIGTIEMLQRLAYNIHGVMDVIDADNCNKIIKSLEQEPCEDCISRKDFIAKVKDIYYGYMLDDDGCCPQDFVDLAEEMPSVTPQVKTGYWIRCDILQELKCSECRRCFRNKTNFCPNCGARMEDDTDAK